MHLLIPLIYSLIPITATASILPTIDSILGICPPVWTTLSSVLQIKYLNTSTSQCNSQARSAIRLAFHDCAAYNQSLSTGGCDGSLVLSATELSRTENDGLQEIAAYIGALAPQYGVGVADLVQFSAAVAIVTCPGGPRVETFIGRTDSSTPPPTGLIPSPFADAETNYNLFKAKGITGPELAALLGAHTCAREFHIPNITAGLSQDTTPGIWDVDYYAQTLNQPEGIFSFPSDRSLAQHPVVGPAFRGFVGRDGVWDDAFAKAMTKLSLLGVPGGSKNLLNVTCALPAEKSVDKREFRNQGDSISFPVVG